MISIAIVLAIATLVAGQQAQRWPTKGWAKGTPQSQGLSAEAFDELDRGIAAGTYGNIDWMVVARGGTLVVDKRYARDYREISRGRTSPIGCTSSTTCIPAGIRSTRGAMSTRCSR